MATQNRYVIADGLLANNAVEGTYNVYFTELEDADVDSFANLVADKIDYNSIKNAPNAAAGNYNDAIGEDAYIHPFKKIAFSGEAQDLDGLANVAISGDYNDLINKPSIEDYNLSVSYDEIEGAPGIVAGEYADEDGEESYLHDFDKIAFSGEYEDLKHAPGIAAGEYADENGGESVLHDFDKIAFSGEYEDLKHAPALPENAYETEKINDVSVRTGNINPLNKAAFGDFSDLSQSNYTTNYIINLKSFTEVLCESESGNYVFSDNSLFSVAGALYNGFAGAFEAFVTYSKTVYLVTKNNMIYTLLSTHRLNDVYDFIFTPIFNTNYDSLKNLSDNEIISQLNIVNNDLAEKLIVEFDWKRTRLYWKLVNNSGINFAVSPAANITNQDITNWNNKSDFSGNYQDLNNLPTLSLVSFSGNYEDLNNKPNVLEKFLDLSTFFDLDRTNEENNKLYSLGTLNNYILNFNKFKNNDNISLDTAIINIVDSYIRYGIKFSIFNNNYRYDILNVNRILSDDDNHNIIIITLDYNIFNNNNYLSIRSNILQLESTEAQQQLDDIILLPQTGCLIFDFEKNIIYCKIKQL